MSIRSTLEPLIRQRGIRRTAREVGVHHALLVRWLTGEQTLARRHKRTLARLFGYRIEPARIVPMKKR